MITNWKNKKVAVLGLGVEGISSVKFLLQKGAKVTVLDRKEEKELDKKDTKILGYKDIKIVTGKGYLKNLDKFDVIVRSPGVRRNLPEILDAETRGRQGSGGQEKGVIITSQTKIFFDLCPSPIIGVTGTKGKGTTATLIYEMLKNQGFDAYLGGNIGKPPFEFLDKLNKHSVVVLELSSFQLQDLGKSPADARAMAGKPHIAVVLMITSEHLDYHKDIYEYVEAKRNILRFQTSSDYAIINRDYPASRESDIHTNAQVFQVSREREVYKQGCFIKGSKVIVRTLGKLGGSEHSENSVGQKIRQSEGQNSQKILDNRLSEYLNFRKTESSEFSEIEIIDIKDILLPGKHNLENVCAAVMAAVLVGVSKENIRKVLKTFKGLEHRLELVREVNGVKYYDDSFSTTPETAIAAIEAFSHPEILILGGSSKGSDFFELGRVIDNAKNIKAIIGIGKEWPKIKSKIKNQKSKIIKANQHLRGGRMDSSEVESRKMIVVEGCKNMKEIVLKAKEIARPGDVVLLSPACASFDMFKNYKDRGEQFKREVASLASS